MALNPKDVDVNRIIKKYEGKLGGQLGTQENQELEAFSREYSIFKKEFLAKGLTKYENYCRKAENIIKVEPGKKDLPRLEMAIETAHLDVSPMGVMSFAVLTGIFVVFLGLLIGVLSFAFTGTIKIFLSLNFSKNVGKLNSLSFKLI